MTYRGVLHQSHQPGIETLRQLVVQRHVQAINDQRQGSAIKKFELNFLCSFSRNQEVPRSQWNTAETPWMSGNENPYQKEKNPHFMATPTRLGLPKRVENLLLGELTKNQYRAWLFTLFGLLFLVPGVDYTVGRDAVHFNLYPIPIMLSIFLFGRNGLVSVLVLLVFYHLVQVRLGLEGRAVLVNSLAQFSLTFVVGLLCCWLVDAYRALYESKNSLAQSRHELLMNLTHELRSPLFAIRGIVRNLSRNFSRLSQKEVLDSLNDAQAAIALINRDIEGLSQVFRADLHELEPRLSHVSVSELYGAVQNRYPPEFHPNHTIIWQNPDKSLVYCDALLTQQILDNLVSNALRHTDGGQVTVSASVSPREIKFTVSDQGCGIPEQDRSRIFLRHDRGSRLSGSSGFGVGLYLVEIYCKVQEGRVEIEDREIGACFAVYLKRGSELLPK